MLLLDLPLDLPLELLLDLPLELPPKLLLDLSLVLPLDQPLFPKHQLIYHQRF